ncbi:MAG: regulatory protein RecX [Corynebacterium sp.]|nr:regulatory protein RecX [Corynebacterium sp.]
MSKSTWFRAMTSTKNSTMTSMPKKDKARSRLSCQERALRLLEVRRRSEKELRDRLREGKFPPEEIDEVIATMKRYNYVNDVDFAFEWVRQRHEMKGKSRAVLNQELRLKGINEELRRSALEQVTDESERARAALIAEKKVRSFKNPPADYMEYQKYLSRILGMLGRRGFNPGMSMSVAKEALAARFPKGGEEPEDFGL